MGRKLYLGFWNFKQLVGCLTTNEIQCTKDKYQDKVSAKVLTYVNRLADTAQYPAARCGMGEDIVMYGQSASSGNKSMNRANNCAHQEKLHVTCVEDDYVSHRGGEWI